MTVRDIATRIEPGQMAPQRSPSPARTPETGGLNQFAEELRRAREKAAGTPTGFQLSAHAQERIQERGISLDVEQQQSMTDALFQLESKGSKDALLLRSDAAFIVNVPSRTVVTAVDTNELRERVFTQIDSAVML